MTPRRIAFGVNAAAQTTATSIRLAQAFEAEKVDWIAIIIPAQFELQFDEMCGYIGEICRAVRIPVVVGVDLSPLVVERVSRSHENLAGVICSTGNFSSAGGSLPVFARGEENLREVIDAGVQALVSPLAGLSPTVFIEIWKAIRSGRHQDAASLQEMIAPVGRLLDRKPPAVVVKKMADLIGAGGGCPRRPHLPLSDLNAAELRDAIEIMQAHDLISHLGAVHATPA